MKAIRVAAAGGPEVLVEQDVLEPVPGPGEVLVRLHAIGVNYIDVYQRNGTYAMPPPFTPGSEGAGTVVSTGDGVSDFRKADRVAFAMQPGSYAEFVVAPAGKLVTIPEAISFRDAAAVMLQGMTAHYLVNSTFPLAAGQFALIHAGAGGVGLLLTQLAKGKDAVVISTVSTAEKEKLAREAGADYVVRYTEVDFAQEARRITEGRGVDVVYDSVGKTTFQGSLQALRPRGLLALFGASSGPVPPFDPQVLNTRGSLYLTRPTLVNYVADATELQWRARALFADLIAGRLNLRTEHDYPLAEAARAHADLEARRTTGKILLIPEPAR